MLWPASALAGGGRGTRSSSSAPARPASAIRTSRSTATAATTSRHYDLDVAYDPATDVLRGVATIRPGRRRTCRASTSTSIGLTVRAITVDGRRRDLEPRRRRADRHAAARRSASATRFTHRRRLRRRAGDRRRRRARRSRASSTPTTARSSPASRDVAATWYPVNDHPLDKASYTFHDHRPDGPRGDRQRRAASASARATARRPGTWDAQEPMASYLTTATIGEFDLRAYRARRHPLLGRDRPRPVRRAPRRAPATQFALSQVGRLVLQAAGAHDQRAGRRRAALVLGQPRHRARLGLLLRRGAHGRRRRLDDAARPQRPHERRHRLLAARSGCGAAPVPRALPDRQRRRHLRADRHDRRVERGDRRQRRLRAVDGRPVRLRRPATSRSRSATPATTSSSAPASFVDDVDGLERPGLDLVRGRRRHARRLDRARARRRAARPTRTTGSSAPPPTRRRRSARSPRGVARAPAGDHRVPRRASSGRTRSRPPAAIVDDVDGLGFALENQTRPDLRAGLLRRPPETGDARRRPRARAPVDRRQPGARRAGSTSGSTRASRPTPSGCGASARGAATAQEIFDDFAAHPGRRPVLGADDRRSRAGPPVRRSRSTDRGAMTLHALRLTDRRRATSSGCCSAWVRRNARRQRHDRRSSSRSPSGSPGRTSTTSSRRGCSRPRSRRGSSPRRARRAQGRAPGRSTCAARRRRRGSARRSASRAPRAPRPRPRARAAATAPRTVAGMSARTEIPTAHQNVEAKAAASGSASRWRSSSGRRSSVPDAAGALSPTCAAASWSLISPCSTTASTAVPIEPPIRCSAFSELVARGTSVALERRVGRGHRRHHRAADPEPAHDQQERQQRVGGRAVEERERDRAEREDEQPDERDAPAADAVGEPPGERHRQRRAEALRRHQQARRQRVLAARHLVVERQDDHGAEERGADEERRRGRGAERPHAEQPDVDQRARRAQRVEHERGHEHDARDDRPPHERIGEAAVRLALRQPEHEQGEPGREQQQPDPVELAGVGAARRRPSGACAASTSAKIAIGTLT